MISSIKVVVIAVALFICNPLISVSYAQRAQTETEAVQLIGLAGLKDNTKGRLTVVNGALRFTHAKGNAEVAAASILDVVTGKDSQSAIGGTLGAMETLALAMDRAPEVSRRAGGCAAADWTRARSSSTSFVSVIRCESLSGSNVAGVGSGGGRFVGAFGDTRGIAEGADAWRAKASTSNGGLTVGLSLAWRSRPALWAAELLFLGGLEGGSFTYSLSAFWPPPL